VWPEGDGSFRFEKPHRFEFRVPPTGAVPPIEEHYFVPELKELEDLDDLQDWLRRFGIEVPPAPGDSGDEDETPTPNQEA
jgi:hypothetical protein